MRRYRIGHDYRSNGLGPWLEGTEVELDDATAEFVERDSPGTLRPLSAGKRAVEAPSADRMSRGGADRAVPPAKPKKPSKKEPKKLSKKERARLEEQERKRAAREAGEGRGGADRQGGPSDQGPITKADHQAVVEK